MNGTQAIRNLKCSEEFRLPNFKETFTEVPIPKNASRRDPMYYITRDGFSFLAMGFTGPEAARWKEAYIKQFNAMEIAIRQAQIDHQKQHVRLMAKGLLA